MLHTATSFSADSDSTVLGQGRKEKKTQRTRKLMLGWGGSEGLGSLVLGFPSVFLLFLKLLLIEARVSVRLTEGSHGGGDL